ncbi:Uncharacterised protein [Flavonifractor plautii]|uniref:Uncharacterized protein n=1 Tax=Flavonifractor plautii TaxID=292800 RepID=A0A174PBM8_FLAPL|nr:Uncharacterised protein [Flavonifractor plautii]
MPASSPSMAQNTAFFTLSPWGRVISIRCMKDAEPTSTCWSRMTADRPPSYTQKSEARRYTHPWARSRSWKSLSSPQPASRIRVAVSDTTLSTGKSPKILMPLRDTQPGGKKSVSLSRMPLPPVAVTPSHPAMAAPDLLSRWVRLSHGRAKHSAPDREAQAVSMADRHQSSRSGAPRPMEATTLSRRHAMNSSGQTRWKIRSAPSAACIWRPKPMGSPDHLA